MCQFASLVLTRDKEFWSHRIDSHEELINFHQLHADGVRGPNVLRVEIVPSDNFLAQSTWRYRVDQDVFPEWHDPAANERRARAALSRRLSAWHWQRVFQFLTEIKTSVPWFQPDGKAEPSWKLYTAGTWANAKAAARAAVRGAAWNAAGIAARTAAGIAARDVVGGAAWDAARIAAWIAARDAAGDVVGGAAKDAAWDAQLMTSIIICHGLPLDQQHIDHVRKRWQVWQKGYALLCDVDGQLYVYAAEEGL